MTKPSKLKRFAELKAAAVAKYGDEDRAKLIAGLEMMHEDAIERMAAGQHVDLAAFTRCVELLEKYRPPLIPAVTLNVVRTTYTPKPSSKPLDYETPPSSSTPAPAADGLPPPPNAQAAPAAPAAPMALPARRNVSQSEFHDQIIDLGDGRVAVAPIKNSNGDWRAAVPTASLGPDATPGPHNRWRSYGSWPSYANNYHGDPNMRMLLDQEGAGARNMLDQIDAGHDLPTPPPDSKKQW
jgi:hypothetical protein